MTILCPARALWLTVLSSFVFAACTAEKVTDNAPETPPAETPEVDDLPEAPDAAVIAVLEQADAKDGTVDMIVHKCAGCSLGMDGMADHSLKVGGYTMHFCMTACLARFEGDPAKEILALEIKD